jgi:hypothetical protein
MADFEVWIGNMAKPRGTGACRSIEGSTCTAIGIIRQGQNRLRNSVLDHVFRRVRMGGC